MKRTVLALAASAVALVVACAHDSGSYAPSGGASSSGATSSTTTSPPSSASASSTGPSSTTTSPSSSSAAAPAAGASAAAATPSQSGNSADMRQTIDCPASALAQAEKSLPPSSSVGTPGGTGSGSGAEAVSGPQGQVQRIEGPIAQIDSSRTARGIEVNGVKLWVEPSTPVLLDCQQSSVAELKEGTPVKAMYEQKNGRNIAKVVEARKQ